MGQGKDGTFWFGDEFGPFRGWREWTSGQVVVD
jgi:hypothetical protein